MLYGLFLLILKISLDFADIFIYDFSMEQVQSFIGALGFPIFAFCLMFYFATYTIKSNTSALNSLRLTIEKLCTKINDKASEKSC